MDTFMCESSVTKSNKFSKNSCNYFDINSFNIEKFDIRMTERLDTEANSKIVQSAVVLLVDIMLYSGLNVKNRQSIFKHFLTHMSEVSLKGSDQVRITKGINIVYSLFSILKMSAHKNIYVINDDSIYASSKMIFDIGFKIENSLMRRISAEGHSLLIKVSSDPQTNISYYLTSMECKFKNESIDNSQFVNTFYTISNIFRYNDFCALSPFLDLYMNFIISYFNRIEDLFNPYISQSIFIITEVLIKNNQIDHARKMIEVFKLNYLFINKDNLVYFKEKELYERNSKAEIKLMILLVSLGDYIKNNEIELLKIILNKYIVDEKFKSKKINQNFLYLAKLILKENSKLKETIHNSHFMQYLFSNVLSFTSNPISKNDFLNLNFSLQILIIYLLNIDFKNIDHFRDFSEKLVNLVNNLYNSNRHFYFNNMILSNISEVPSNRELIFDINSDNNLSKVSILLDLENRSFNDDRFIYLGLIYSSFIIIKLAKLFLKIYIEKKHTNFVGVINLIKELIQNQLSLYKNEIVQKANVTKNDALTKSEDTKEISALNKPLILIRNLNSIMHLNLKKFLIKALNSSLEISLNTFDTQSIQNKNSNLLIEFLNLFMNCSMQLISCEESMLIRIKGVYLLLGIIKRFSNIKDNRTDDGSLLIQQYEAQIGSCIKKIFTNNYSITALYKGLKILYQYVSIPITTDYNFIKKIENYINFNLKESFGIGASGLFSEKLDHIFVCKKLNFFCKMYLSTTYANNKFKSKKSKIKDSYFNIVDVLDTKIFKWFIYYENINNNENLKILNDFFSNDFDLFFMNIFNMLNDFFIILTLDKKFVKQYKDFEFLASGNRISYSHHKVLKYGKVYLKILGFLVNDIIFIKSDVKNRINEKISKTKENQIDLQNQEVSNPHNLNLNAKSHRDYSFDNIFKLIFYFINYFANSKLDTNGDFKLPEFVIYSENDVTDSLKEKIMFNNLLISEMLDVIKNLLTNQISIVKISKSSFLDIFKIVLNLFNLNIDEIDIKLFTILDCLFSNWFDGFIDEDAFTNSENIDISTSLSKLLYNYHQIKFKTVPHEAEDILIISFIEILNLNISILLKISFCETNEIQQNIQEIFYDVFEILFTILNNSNNSTISKLCVSKLFSLLVKLDNLKQLELILPMISKSLKHNNKQFEKFFLLFFTTLQLLSKVPSENNEIKDYLTSFIYCELIKPKINDLEILNFIIKGLNIAFSQSLDKSIRSINENLIVHIIENTTLSNLLFKSEDLQGLIFNTILNLEEKEKRIYFIKLFFFTLDGTCNSSTLNTPNTSIFLFKLLSKDLDLLNELSSNLDVTLVSNLNHLIQIGQAQQNKLIEEKKEIKTEEENSNTKIEIKNNKNISPIQSSTSTGPKLKALKFK